MYKKNTVKIVEVKVVKKEEIIFNDIQSKITRKKINRIKKSWTRYLIENKISYNFLEIELLVVNLYGENISFSPYKLNYF